MAVKETHSPLKELYLDAILGTSPVYGYAEHLVKTGFMTFTGNQHNEKWSWNKRVLEDMSAERLKDFYTNVKERMKARG